MFFFIFYSSPAVARARRAIHVVMAAPAGFMTEVTQVWSVEDIEDRVGPSLHQLVIESVREFLVVAVA